MSIGIFDDNADIGTVLHTGSAVYDDQEDTYLVTGSGLNMWLTEDAFQYVWKEVSGDVALTADLAFPRPGTDPHRKACLVIRQSLDASSAYADAALHGDGLTSLQFRHTHGATTHEVQANVSAPRRLRLEKRGHYVSLFLVDEEDRPHFSGASTRLVLQEPFYIGLGVCAHNQDMLETAMFSDVTLETDLPSIENPVLYSVLETQAIASTDRRVCHVTPTHIEAPNWLPDGSGLVVNSGGRMYQIPVAGGTLAPIDTGFAIRCNNDHGISPDGTQLVVSDQSQEQGQSLIYILPLAGGTPERITPLGPSYWHGWSPDGKTLTFCGQRDGTFGIFTIPADGSGPETRLTTAKSLDDGPEYSPDGQYIYFNSDRTGRMQIWRMHSDGSDQEQVTFDEFNNWFAHPSPDGRFLVLLSYGPDVSGHPPNKDVTLRLLPLDTPSADFTILARLFGGQGTINVPCWSPDSKHIAFVTYQMMAS